MIRATITKKNGNFQSVLIKGHAHGARNGDGHDLICSAVSALAYTMAYAVVELVGVKPKTEDKDGYFRMTLSQDVSPRQFDVQNTIVATFEIGIREIASVYPKNVKLESEEVESNA